MPKDYKVYLDDIIESIEKIRAYIENMSFEAFYSDPRTVDAVNRNLGIIGEAANKIPREVKFNYSNIEWAKIIGLRNIIIHDYNAIDLEVIWDIIQNRLTQLETQVKAMLKD